MDYTGFIWLGVIVAIIVFLCIQRRRYHKRYLKTRDVKNAKYLGF